MNTRAGNQDAIDWGETGTLKDLYDFVRDDSSISYPAFLRKLHRLEQGNRRTINALCRRLGLPVETARRASKPSESGVSERVAKPPVVVRCIECEAPIRLEGYPRLYCSPRCRQILKAIHYGRGVAHDGRIEKPDVREAIQIKIAFALAGGYPERERNVSRATREAAFARDGRLCQLCGEPATELDHIAGNSPDLANLRALCADCNMARAQGNMRPATSDEAQEYDRIISRMLADEPLLHRDDEFAWGARYRAMQAEQRRLMRQAGIRIKG